MATSSKLRLKCLTVTRCGGYAQQYRRPYVFDCTPAKLYAFEQLMREHRTAQQREWFPIVQVAHDFTDLLRTSPDACSAVELDDGWAAPRLRWFAEVEFTLMPSGATMTGYYSGYSGAVEFGDLDSLPIDTPLTLNTYCTTREAQYPGPEGLVQRTDTLAAGRLLENSKFSAYDPAQQYLACPEEVFAGFTSLNLLPGSFVDLRTMITDTPKIAHLNHSVPALYLHTLCNGFAEAVEIEASNVSGNEIYAWARGLVSDARPNRDPLLKHLADQYLGGRFSTQLTYGQLLELQPEIVVLQEHTYRAGRAEDVWQSCTPQAHIATMANQVLPALLAEAQLREAVFSASNYNGVTEINTLEGQTLQGEAASYEQLSAFNTRLRVYLFNYATLGGELTLSLRGRAELFGDTSLKVQMPQHDLQHFVWPTFADARLQPWLMDSKQHSEFVQQAVNITDALNRILIK